MILGPGLMLLRFVQGMDLDEEYKSVAATYFELAKEPGLYEQVQAIFDRTRLATALQSYQKVVEQADLLFHNLRQSIAQDRHLKGVLEAKKIVLPDIVPKDDGAE